MGEGVEGSIAKDFEGKCEAKSPAFQEGGDRGQLKVL